MGTAGDAGDSLTFGGNVQTGNMFGSAGSLNCKCLLIFQKLMKL